MLKLKGIGAYTASSFLALAFNLPETVIDGNVIRIICRLYHLTEPVEQILPLIREKAQALTDPQHPADYASAIMDLGAVICTPKNRNACFVLGKTPVYPADCRNLNKFPTAPNRPKRKKTAAFT